MLLRCVLGDVKANDNRSECQKGVTVVRNDNLKSSKLSDPFILDAINFYINIFCLALITGHFHSLLCTLDIVHCANTSEHMH